MKLESPQHLNEKYLASLLKADALLFGANKIEYLNVKGWSIVCANKNWLESESIDLPVIQFFSRILPHDGSGVNSIRSEVVVGAFSSRVFIWDSQHIELAFGALSDKDTQEITAILSNTELTLVHFGHSPVSARH